MLAAFVVSSLLLSGPAEAADPASAEAEGSQESAPTPAVQAPEGVINGVVKDQETGEVLEDAVVLLQCECLEGVREVFTNSRGIYQFGDLPPGTYTIQVLKGEANVSKITTLPRDAKFRANFTIDPERRWRPRRCEGHNCEKPWTGPEPRYWGGNSYGSDVNLRNGGLGLLVAGGGMAVGSVLAGTVNMCGRDGAHGTDCSKDTRVQLAIGFGVTAAVLTAAGGAMVGVAEKRRKMKVGFAGDRNGASVSVSGRF